MNLFPLESRCYDWDAARWCKLTKIDAKTGGVFVAYEKDDQYENERLISPDQLVGVSDYGTTNLGGVILEDSSDQDALNYDGDDDEDDDKNDDSIHYNEQENNSCDIITDEDFRTTSQSEQLGQSAPRNSNIPFLDNSDMEVEQHFESDAHSESATLQDARLATAGTLLEKGTVDDSLQNEDVYTTNTSTVKYNAPDSGPVRAPDIAREALEKNEASIPKFEIRKDDPYVTPQVGELVTYLYHAPDQYRVGVKCTKSNLLRFFLKESSIPDHYPDKFLINKKGFRNGRWRARSELSIGR